MDIAFRRVEIILLEQRSQKVMVRRGLGAFIGSTAIGRGTVGGRHETEMTARGDEILIIIIIIIIRRTRRRKRRLLLLLLLLLIVVEVPSGLKLLDWAEKESPCFEATSSSLAPYAHTLGLIFNALMLIIIIIISSSDLLRHQSIKREKTAAR